MCAGSPLAGVPKGTPTGELHLTVLACSQVEMDPGRVKLGPGGMLALLPNPRLQQTTSAGILGLSVVGAVRC